jgi:ataxia telangiectasia mutated family protein
VSGVVEDGVQDSHKKREEQAGEAGRALSVVEKKLSKTLSTPATVNELIQTATDERNLAVLYCGWASYA